MSGGQWPFGVVEGAELREIHRKHRRVDLAIRVLGALVLMGGIVISISAVLAVLAMLAGDHELPAISVAALAVVAPVEVYAGRALYHLRPAGRVAFVALVGLNLLFEIADGLWGATAAEPLDLGHTVGSLLFSALIAASLWSQRASVVFSEHYREVVRPAVVGPERRRSPRLALWILGLTLALTATLVWLAQAPV